MAERQINTFDKGLASDYAGELQPNSFYVDSLEGRIIYNEDGTLAWQNMKGTRKELDISFDYGNSDEYILKGFAETKDGAIILSYSGLFSPVYNEIGRLYIDSNGDYQYRTLFNDKYDPNGESLNFEIGTLNITQSYYIYGKAIYENEKAHRVYFNDGVNEPKVFNIQLGKEPEFTNGDYQPLNSGVYPYYYSVNSFRLNPNIVFGRLIYEKDIDGSIDSGYYHYTYRYGTRDGYKSPWFPSGPKVFATPIGKNSSNSEEYYMGESGNTTTTGHRVYVENFDTRFDEVEFAYIYYKTQDQPDHASIFATRAITPSDGPNVYADHISNGGDPISIDEIPLTFRAFKNARADNIKDQRYFIGNYNIYDIDEVSVDNTGIEPITRRIEIDEKSTDYNSNFPIRNTAMYDGRVELGRYYNRNTSSVDVQRFPINDDYLNYNGKQISNVAKSMFRGEPYRIGVLMLDLKGNPWFVKHVADITMPKQYTDDYTISYLDNNGNVQTQNISTGNGAGYYALTNNDPDDSNSISHIKLNDRSTNLDSLGIIILGVKIDGIDISDVKDKVSGFQVVRAERNGGLEFQGILSNMVFTDGSSDPRINPTVVNKFDPTNGNALELPIGASSYAQFASGNKYRRKDYNFAVDSPDLTIPDIGPQYNIGENTDIEIQNAYYADGKDVRSGAATNDYPLIYNTNSSFNHYGKFYYYDVDPEAPNGDVGRTFQFDNLEKLGPFADDQIDNFNNNGDTAKGENDYYDSANNIIYEGQATWDTWVGNAANKLKSCDCYNSYSWMCFFLANFYNGRADYGGLSQNSLENTIYVPMGHFQPIDDDVINNIHDGSGNYVFDDVEVFGGDSYVGIYDRTKILSDYKKNSYYDASYLFPIESKYNVELIAGRSYASVGSFGGGGIIHYDDPGGFNYNTSLLTREQHFLYNGYPDDFQNITSFPNTWVYSDKKFYGEKEDSFRKFRTNSFSDINGSKGEITGSAILFDEMYSLQEYGVGRLRINDREVVTSQESRNLNVGTGGALDGVDYINEHYGTQYRGSIVETPTSFYYVDNIKKKIVRFARNGVDPISDTKNIHSLTYNKLTGYDKNEPSGNYWTNIVGAYDYKNGDVLFSFYEGQNNKEAFVFNESAGRFVTRTNIAPNFAFNIMSDLVVMASSDQDSMNNAVFSYGNGDYGDVFGFRYDSSISFYVNKDMQYSKVFDNIYINTEIDNISRINRMFFNTESYDHQINTPDDRIEYREGIIKLPIHEKSENGKSKPRARGQKMLVKLEFNNFSSDLIKIINTETIYRYSRKL